MKPHPRYPRGGARCFGEELRRPEGPASLRGRQPGRRPRDCRHTADPDRLLVVKPYWIQESHEHRFDIRELVIAPRILLPIAETPAVCMEGCGTIP